MRHAGVRAPQRDCGGFGEDVRGKFFRHHLLDFGEPVPGYSKAAIPAANLGVEVVLGVHTNGNHYAKAIVTANSGGTITLQFTTFGVAAAPGGEGGPPTITSVKNNSSLIAAGFPNYGIAPSSIFMVTGRWRMQALRAAIQRAPGLPLL